MSAVCELQIPSALARWISAHMDRAPDLSGVRIFCGEKLPFDRWLKPYVGVTLWNRIYLREPFSFEDNGKFELLIHELVHVRQFQQSPLLFPLKYLWYLMTRGYANHPAEYEAITIAAQTRSRFNK